MSDTILISKSDGVHGISGTSSQVAIGGSTPSFSSVPAAAITALTGTISGTATLSGAVTLNSPTLGGNLVAGGFKITNLDAPSAASSDAATASYAEAQKTGGAVRLYTTSSITANNYVGSFGQASNASPTQVGGFSLPAAGKLKAIAVTGFNNASSSTVVTVYKSSDNGNSYSSTSLAVTVSSGTAGNTATGSVSVAANDLIIVLVSAAWTVAAGQWWQAAVQYVVD